MADRQRGTGFLGELGTRLQRMLNFDGEPGATFSAQAVPVLIVGNGMLPGYASQQARRFVVTSGTLGAGGFFYVQANEDVIINQIRLVMEVAGLGNQEWRMMARGTAPAVAPAAAGLFLDRSLSNNDRPPISTYNNPAATAGAVVQFYAHTATSPPQGVYVTLCDQPFLLSAGQAHGFLNNTAGTNPRYEIWGQTL